MREEACRELISPTCRVWQWVIYRSHGMQGNLGLSVQEHRRRVPADHQEAMDDRRLVL